MKLFSRNTEIFQLIKQTVPLRVRVLHTETFIRRITNMTQVSEFRGQPNLSFIQLAFRSFTACFLFFFALAAAVVAAAGLAADFRAAFSSGNLCVKYIGIFQIRKRQSSHVFISGKRVKERGMLDELESVVEFLFPDDTLMMYQVNDANVERVRFLVFEERNSAPDIGVGPLVWVGIRNVQASHCGRINFGSWQSTPYFVLVFCA